MISFDTNTVGQVVCLSKKFDGAQVCIAYCNQGPYSQEAFMGKNWILTKDGQAFNEVGSIALSNLIARAYSALTDVGFFKDLLSKPDCLMVKD